jgi:hypothetical protein
MSSVVQRLNNKLNTKETDPWIMVSGNCSWDELQQFDCEKGTEFCSNLCPKYSTVNKELTPVKSVIICAFLQCSSERGNRMRTQNAHPLANKTWYDRLH